MKKTEGKGIRDELRHAPIIAWAHNVTMRRFLLIVALLISNPAWAWNSGTHRLIADIAWQQLSPSAKSAVSSLLLSHPDYEQWTGSANSGLKNRAAFVEAATWPDNIRQDPRFYDELSESPSAAIPGLPETARHRHWHYTDRQVDGSPREGTGTLETELPRLIKLLADPSTPRIEKIYALPWIIHLVGEIHQPLHVGSRHDKGGNLFEVEDPDDPRQKVKALHRWWDDLPAPPWLRDTELNKNTKRLLERYPTLPAPGNPEIWLQESFLLARQQAYPPSRMIAPEFRSQARRLADRRTAEAGYRLGMLLQGIFGGVSRETGSE